MSRRLVLREGEIRIISVTPVSKGVIRPLLYSIAVVALIVVGAQHFHLVHRYQAILLWVIAGPCALVTLTRVWRWRSHKVRVTNQRVVVEGGVIRHRRSVIDLHDVVATHIGSRRPVDRFSLAPFATPERCCVLSTPNEWSIRPRRPTVTTITLVTWLRTTGTVVRAGVDPTVIEIPLNQVP
jgi:membrane protein YdbS with pleckstrin-like domain